MNRLMVVECALTPLLACNVSRQHEEREMNKDKVQNAMKDIAAAQQANKDAQLKR